MRIVALILAGLALAACGGGSDADPVSKPAASTAVATTTPPPAPVATADPAVELEEAVRAYSSAFLDGDGAGAYELLSERCRDRTPLSEFASITEQAKTAYGPQDVTSIDVTVNGEQAQATYGYADASLNQDKEPWVNEAGWRNDDC